MSLVRQAVDIIECAKETGREIEWRSGEGKEERASESKNMIIY